MRVWYWVWKEEVRWTVGSRETHGISEGVSGLEGGPGRLMKVS